MAWSCCNFCDGTIVVNVKTYENLNDMAYKQVVYHSRVFSLVAYRLVNSRKRASIAALWRSLQYLGITRKKLQKAALERNEIC
ncbi:hypothetical protein RCL_jg18112.t1 [Rhizophagus clarus]|uniref:Uncharacterized protein n=1 Tax=Rhizophagus clarus TaxID=94130 RepID=A0A8H3QDY3_9GLOM|nr:hypothetical protein RCL_jg18112.t1 [Rhizophagus clarus]